jgi:hypothetical protein
LKHARSRVHRHGFPAQRFLKQAVHFDPVRVLAPLPEASPGAIEAAECVRLATGRWRLALFNSRQSTVDCRLSRG